MPVIKGEKWACASCIKGHRVSGCTHTDRELHHINPKGRPVKQCEHCRGARKSKSHHARCDCGDKKDKDKNKDKGDSKDGSSCRCHHGNKCVCGLKREPLDLKLQTKLSEGKSKPRLAGAHAESNLTVFANGHHKPCHRMNNSAHNSGAPYKIPRPHTLHGPIPSHHAYESIGGGYNGLGTPQRSVDNLPTLANSMYNPFGPAQRSVENLALAPLSNALDGTAAAADFNTQKYLFGSQMSASGTGSGHGSPGEAALNDALSGPQQWAWLASTMGSSGQLGFGEDLSVSPTADFLPTPDTEFAIPSAGLESLWSPSDLPLETSTLVNALNQPVSNSGESNRVSVPGLTTASSGPRSEIGDSALFRDLDLNTLHSSATDHLFWDDNLQIRDPPYRMNAAAHRQAPTSIPEGEGRRSLDLQSRPVSDGLLFEQEARHDPGNSPFERSIAEPPVDGAKGFHGMSYDVGTPAAFTSADYATLAPQTSPAVTTAVDGGTTSWLPLLGDGTFDHPLVPLESSLEYSWLN